MRELLAATYLVLVVLAGSGFAEPVQWTLGSGGNGHFYELKIGSNQTWQQAKTAAEGLAFKGEQGHLATITSSAERDFIKATLSSGSYWLGGFQDTNAPDYSEPGGGWSWITGEAWGFTNWGAVEPNNEFGGEDFLETASGVDMLWNDLDSTDRNLGYYAEFVPEPPSLLISLLLASLTVVFRYRRRLGFLC